MERNAALWNAFKNIAIVFSFAVNLVLVVVLLLAIDPGLDFAFDLKREVVQPLLIDLDNAFLGLGEATIDTTVQIDHALPIAFDLPLDQSLPISFQLAIEQDTSVILQRPVPLSGLPAQFNLPSGGGVINGVVSLSLPAGLLLPVHLSMVVPVSETVPVRMVVPVQETIPVRMQVPVHIMLGESGLNPAVDELRAVFSPLREQVRKLPDRNPLWEYLSLPPE